MALPESERHDFMVWLNRLDYGDIPGEALAELAAEVWDQDDRHAPLQAKPVAHTCFNQGQLLGCQSSEESLRFHRRNRNGILNQKGSGLEKGDIESNFEIGTAQ